MIIFLLILIIIAILFSTEKGRDLLGGIASLPLRVLSPLFRNKSSVVNQDVSIFLKTLPKEDLVLLDDDIKERVVSVADIKADIDNYKLLLNGKIDPIYFEKEIVTLHLVKKDHTDALLDRENKLPDLLAKIRAIGHSEECREYCIDPELVVNKIRKNVPIFYFNRASVKMLLSELELILNEEKIEKYRQFYSHFISLLKKPEKVQDEEINHFFLSTKRV